MKRMKVLVAVLLLATFLLTGCSQLPPVLVGISPVVPAAEEGPSALAPEAADNSPAPQPAKAAPNALVKEADGLFRAKFEGSSVAGSGEVVDGKYRFTATNTDGEAWHVKLESNYPTVSGRDYRVTYRFHSDVGGSVKFGDFQEFPIQPGDNSVTGILIANGCTSYLDLQLGMLPPFTIDFSEVEVEEYSDELGFENALTSPVKFEKEKCVYERHDQGYAPILTRSADAVSINYLATSWESGVWKSRLYVKTGLYPEPGVHYHVTADVTCDEDMPFEVLLNDGDVEKGYGALYGQSVAAGKVTTCESVITGVGNGDELVLQFSLGEAPEESTVKVSNVRVEKIGDHYRSMLPTGFALDKEYATGRMITTLTPSTYTDLSLPSFSYSSKDSVFEGHDDGYKVRMEESSSSVIMDIYQAPAAASDRGVWKVKLYADTGAVLQAGTTYKVSFDLVPDKDQGEYEVCFDSTSGENAYGALYGRSLTAGVEDHVSYIFTPTESKGALILRLQLGKTDTAAGNRFTFRNLAIASLPTSYTDILSPSFSYDTPPAPEPEYTSVLPAGFSYNTGVNVYEQHDNGYDQSVSANGSSATLNISGAPSDGRNLWNSKLLIHTGFTPQAGTKYIASFDITAAKDQAKYEVCFDGAGEKDYGGEYDLALTAGSTQTVTHAFTPDASHGPLVLRFQLGQTNDASGNSITVSNLKVAAVTGTGNWSSVLPGSFAYPVVSTSTPDPEEPGYRPVTLGDLTASESHDAGYEQTLDGLTLTITAVPAWAGGIWCSKLFVDTGVALEAGAKYRVTAGITSSKAMSFELCYNNGSVEKGYGALYGQSIGAGEAKELVHEFTVSADTAPQGSLTLQFQLGNSPADNTFSVSSVTVEKYVPAHEEEKPIPAAYESVPSGLSLSQSHDAGYVQALNGNTLTISAIPDSDTGVWKSKLFADTGVVLENGEQYRIVANVSSSKAMGFEICYNNGSVEKGYEALYGAGIGEGATESYEKIFTVPAETVAGNLVLQFQLGSSPAENDFTVNSVTVEKLIPEHTETINVEAAYTELQTSLSASEGHDAGYEQALDGNSRALTISAVPPRENGVWKSKLFVDTGMAPTAGEKYRVTADVTSGKAFAFEICFNNGAAEKGYGALYGQSIGAGETKSFALEFEVSADVVTNNLVLQFQLGDSPADNTFTVNSVTVEKWTEATDSEPVTTVDPKSFELWAHETYTAELSGDGSSAAVNFTASPDGSLEVWKTKLFANTGVTLEGGKSYRISADVQAASNLLYEICYNDGGTEKGVGALYNLTATAEAQTVTFEVTPENSASLVIQFSLGNAAAGNSVTVRNINVEELGETTGDNLLTDSLTAWAPVHHWADGGYDVSLSNTGSSASADISAVPSDQADWKLKLFIETGAQLTAGKQYRIRYNIQADSSFDYNVFYNNGAEEKAVGEFYGLNTGAAAVEHIVTPGNNATLTIQLMLGTTSAPNHVTVSNVQVEEIVYASGEPQHGSVNFWAHEDYEAALSGTESSASLAITKVPETDRAGWKVKLFAETGTELKAGRTYRISLDVQATAEQDYEICFNNLEHEAALGVLQNLSASTEKQTVTYTITPENAAVLTLQLNLGLAGGANTITISGLKVEQVSFDTGTSVIPSFRYDTVGYISTASDDGYVVSLDQHESSADFYIHHAPSKRNPWNVKLNVKTGLTPKAGKGYRVTFELIATKAQNLFEVFYDGKTEAAYGALYEQSLKAGKNKVSFLIMPDSGTGALSLQIRLGKTNGTDGNSYTFRNLKIEEVGFTSSTAPEIKAVTYLWTHEDYSSALAKTPDKATVRIEKTPETGKEPWKTKLFVDTGVQLKPGEKYRISFNVKSIIPAPFEVCFNNGDEEKGLGGMFGLFSSPAGHYVEFVTYAKQDTHLVIQLSLGNCIPPNSIILSGLKVEKAGTVNLISDTIYTF